MTTPAVPAVPSLSPGVRSSELWLTVATIAADGVLAFLHVDVTRYVPLAAVLLPQVAVIAYVVGRTALKLRWPSNAAAVHHDLAIFTTIEAAGKSAVADIEAHKSELLGLARTIRADVGARKQPVKPPAV